jgi:hypothetical protein
VGGIELILSGQVVCSWAGDLKVGETNNQKKKTPKHKFSNKRVNKGQRIQ